jgi:hypothetical protein
MVRAIPRVERLNREWREVLIGFPVNTDQFTGHLNTNAANHTDFLIIMICLAEAYRTGWPQNQPYPETY